jgi:hypothetical protein
LEHWNAIFRRNKFGGGESREGLVELGLRVASRLISYFFHVPMFQLFQKGSKQLILLHFSVEHSLEHGRSAVPKWGPGSGHHRRASLRRGCRALLGGRFLSVALISSLVRSVAFERSYPPFFSPLRPSVQSRQRSRGTGQPPGRCCR